MTESRLLRPSDDDTASSGNFVRRPTRTMTLSPSAQSLNPSESASSLELSSEKLANAFKFNPEVSGEVYRRPVRSLTRRYSVHLKANPEVDNDQMLGRRKLHFDNEALRLDLSSTEPPAFVENSPRQEIQTDRTFLSPRDAPEPARKRSSLGSTVWTALKRTTGSMSQKNIDNERR